jgi:uncharacterized tellurite resistance protein B-like protein
VLEFSRDDLAQQLLRRYPRIGARFYRNLSDHLVQRLAPLGREARMRLMRLVCSFAWADREVHADERRFVARLVERLALDAEERSRVEAWLAAPPPPKDVDASAVPHEHRLLFVEAIAALLLADGELAAEEIELFRPLVS